MNLGQRVVDSLDNLVEFAKVINSMDCAIGFLRGKHGHSPSCIVDWLKEAELDLAVKFPFDNGANDHGNGVRLLTTTGCRAVLAFNVELATVIVSNFSTEECVKFGQELA